LGSIRVWNELQGATGMRRGHVARADRRTRAEALKELRDKRTPEQQLELLDQRLGEGEGATRERQSLKLEIEKRREARDRSSSERVSERKGSTREKGERSKVNSKERRRRDKSRSRGGRQDAS